MNTLDQRDSLSQNTIINYRDIALNLSAEIRKLILDYVKKGFATQKKADASLVTEADTAAERLFRDLTAKMTKECGVIGEEYGRSQPDAEFQWVIDPIDGTAEFARGLPVYGSILALYYQQAPIVGVIDLPSLNKRFSAAYKLGAFCNADKIKLEDILTSEINGNERVATSPPWNYVRNNGEIDTFDRLAHKHPNLRVYHSCYSQTCAVEGSVDAAVEWKMKIWDIAAAQILTEEAGGAFYYINKPQDWSGGIYSAVMGKPTLAKRLVEVVR